MKRNIFLYAILCLTLLLLPHHTKAAELITNGSFETGNFTGWTITNAAGSWNNWQNAPAGSGGGFNPPYTTAPQHGTRDVWNGVTPSANQHYIMYQQVTIPAGQTASLQWRDRFQMNLLDFCTSAATCGQAFYFVEITDTSNNVLRTLYTVTAPPLTETDTGWVSHYALLTDFAGQTVRIRFRDYATVTLAGPGQVEIDAVSLLAPAILNPTPANATVGGRVLTADGAGISRVTVTLTDGTGNLRSSTTNSFGYYHFADVAVGGTYTLEINNKKYFFPDSPRVVSVQDNIADLNFVASP